jgi:hypothetical protein
MLFFSHVFLSLFAAIYFLDFTFGSVEISKTVFRTSTIICYITKYLKPKSDVHTFPLLYSETTTFFFHM